MTLTRPHRLSVVGMPDDPARELARLIERLGALRADLDRLAARLAGAETAGEPRHVPAKWLAYQHGVTPRTVIRWACRCGAGRKLGGRWLIDRVALQAWLDGR